MEKELETEFEKKFGGRKAKIGFAVCAVLVAILAVSNLWLFLIVNTLETDKNSLQSQMSGLQTDKNNLQSQVDFLGTWLEGNKTSLGELEEEYSMLNVTYDMLYSDFASLQSEYECVQSQYEALTETYGFLYQNYSSLETDYTKLTTNFTALKGQYTELIQNYTNLLTQYNGMSANCTSLQAAYQNLLTNYSNLEVQYEGLQSNHTILQTDYDNLQTQYNSLQLLYDDLQTEYNSYVTSYQRLRDKINHRWGLQNLETFITPEDSTVNTYVFDITGGWSKPDDWNEYWDDLKAMYNWVIDNIEYRSDGLYPNLPDDPSDAVDYWKEMWQFPNETLDLRQGDCEDMAILLCSMIRCYDDMHHRTECIGITSSTASHLAVQCPIEDYKLVIFDPAGDYYSSDWFGNIVFNNISIEIDNWLDYWKSEMGNNVYVDLVFSDDIHETFISTDEYIAWMYSMRARDVEGTVDYTFEIIEDPMRVADGNTFIYAIEWENWAGDFEGTAEAFFRVGMFSWAGFWNVWLRTTFTGTVNGESGTLVIQLVGKKPDGQDWYGQWVILSGTSELADLRGRGTWGDRDLPLRVPIYGMRERYTPSRIGKES